MKVIKKNGSLQDFDLEKIKTSIRNTAMDIGVILSNKDVELIASDIHRIIKEIREEDGKTSYLEIRAAVRNELIHFGFLNVANQYDEVNTN